MSTHELGQPTPRIALEACADELRRRCEAVARLQGGSTYYQEELGIFRDFAWEKDLYLRTTPPELSRTPDEEGNEHQVWFDSASHCYLKATWPDFFGMRVVHRNDEDPKASPVAIRDRLTALDPNLAATIDRSLLRNPKDRYPDTAKLLEAIQSP